MSTAPTPRNGAETTQQAREIGETASHTTWRIDPTTARVEFMIRKRLMFIQTLTVTGRFTGVSGAITLDEQEPSTARAEVTIDAASIDTQNARRDKHLRTVDFFHVEEHPHLTFTSQRIEAVDRAAGTYRIIGDLTVRGVTREVTLDAHYMSPVAAARAPRISSRSPRPSIGATLASSGTSHTSTWRTISPSWSRPRLSAPDPRRTVSIIRIGEEDQATVARSGCVRTPHHK